jgi:hypothetical protein
MDLMVGMYAKGPPELFGFSDTALRVFILMASRRLKSDRLLHRRLYGRGLYGGRHRLDRQQQHDHRAVAALSRADADPAAHAQCVRALDGVVMGDCGGLA